mgnify:CR=1 FL=1
MYVLYNVIMMTQMRKKETNLDLKLKKLTDLIDEDRNLLPDNLSFLTKH